MVLEALSFGVAVAFILVGIVGIVVPILPGMVLVWATVLAFAWLNDFSILGPVPFAVITLIALVTGSANIWLPLLGAQKTGAARGAIFLGIIGAIIGTFIFPLVGTIIGYALGILLGEFIRQRDLGLATKASLGGLAGWGIATVLELSGAVMILIVFAGSILSG